MTTRLRLFWDQLYANFWFVPALMAAGAILLAAVSIALDRAIDGSWESLLSWVYTGGPEGARALLSAIAGSMIGVAGTIFSITIAALTLASSQFGPRLLGNFVRDRGNQLVLGTFIATFLYCLLILRIVRTHDEERDIAAFVPQMSVTLAVLLAVACVGVLIYFIGHVARDIQAEHVIVSVSAELQHAIDHLFPKSIGEGVPARQLSTDEQARIHELSTQGSPLTAPASGYVQAIDGDTLMDLACKHDLLLAVQRQPGSFVIKTSTLALVLPGAHLDEALIAKLQAGFVLGQARTLKQDILFGIDQLVEIALRALSPGINDPFTAMSCINHLGAALCTLAERAFPPAYRYDEQQRLRIVAEPISFASVVDRAFTQIRHYGRDNRVVLGHLLMVTVQISACLHTEEQREALIQHTQAIGRSAASSLPDCHERAALTAQVQETLKLLASVEPEDTLPYKSTPM